MWTRSTISTSQTCSCTDGVEDCRNDANDEENAVKHGGATSGGNEEVSNDKRSVYNSQDGRRVVVNKSLTSIDNQCNRSGYKKSLNIKARGGWGSIPSPT